MTSAFRTSVPLTAILVSFTTACGGLSLGGASGGSKPGGGTAPSGGTTPEVPQPTASPASEAEADRPDAIVFVGLTEEQSTENARKLKDELRTGFLARIFPEGELLAEVTAICGTKIWDVCQVARSRLPNALGWTEWTFKRKDSDQLHRYPDMFYAKAESRSAKRAVEYILRHGDAGPVLVKMTQDKCGVTFTDRCRVVMRHGSGFVLTVKSTGEVIEVMKTLDTWKADL
jgi:hypothetical protein